MSEAVDEDLELSDEDVEEIISIISKDGIYLRSEIVRVSCPICGEEFIGTKRHAGGFLGGHQVYHESIIREYENAIKHGGV